MLNLGLSEMVLIAILLIVFVGPERLPDVMRFMGRGYGKIRRASEDLRRAFQLEVDKVDAEARAKEIRARREALAARRRAEREAREAERAAREAAGEGGDAKAAPQARPDPHAGTDAQPPPSAEGEPAGPSLAPQFKPQARPQAPPSDDGQAFPREGAFLPEDRDDPHESPSGAPDEPADEQAPAEDPR